MEKQKQKETKVAKTTSQLQEEPVKTKKRNGLSGVTFAIVALSLVLASAVVLGVTGAYFTGNQTVEGTITLGDPVSIKITQGGSSVSSLTFTGKATPGTVYDQAISVTSPASTSDAVLRAKVTLTNTDTASQNVEAGLAGNWTELQEDGYYYYNGKLSATESVDFISSLTIPTSLTNDDANKTYAVSVVVEAIQFANGAASATWTTAPEEWKTTYGSGTPA